MGVAVLPTQDFLTHHYHHRQVVFPASRNPSPNPNTNRSNRRRKTSNSPPPVENQTRRNSPPVPGHHVRILKRGEDVSSDKRQVPARKTDGFFAGSTVTSPPPSSVPLPAFFTTARRSCGLSVSNNLEIESELKKVLRLC